MGIVAETCQNPRVAPYTWTVREGSLDGPLIMREYVYDVPDREPVEGQELYLFNGSGPWRVCLVEQVPEVPRSPYNILVVESVYQPEAARSSDGAYRDRTGDLLVANQVLSQLS